MKHILYIVLAVLSVLMVSCDLVHEFPKEEVDPTKILVTLSVKCQVQIPLASVIIVKGDALLQDSVGRYDRRFIIEVYNNSDSDQSYLGTKVITREATDTSALVTELSLETKKYKLAIWMDYVLKGTDDDLYYFTENSLSLVHLPSAEEYVAGSDFKDGQAFVTDIDLTPYRGQWYVSITLDAPLMRPMAKITILATDIAEYVSKKSGVGKDYAEAAKELKTQYSYSGYLPTGYNVLKNRINDSELGYGFAYQPYYPFSQGEIKNMTCIGSDYVFVNGETSSVTLSILIKDKLGITINKVDGLVVPIYRGKETIVMDKFLTDEYKPGIGIDPEFEGEWNIIIK